MCDACMKGKKNSESFKNEVSTSRPLALLHIDLFGLTRTQSLDGKQYVFVIVDDYTRFTWVIFLASKSETFRSFEKFCRRVQNDKGLTSSKIRSDHGEEFENEPFKCSCEENGFEHNFSCAIIPQQNGVVERKNRSLQEMVRTMLCDKKYS